jgi:hypothetical protein
MKKATPFLAGTFSFMLVFGMVVTGCSDVGLAERPQELLEFTRTDMLALQRLTKTHETPIEDLQTSVEVFLKGSPDSRSVTANDSAIVVSGVQKFTSVYENGFSSATVNARSVLSDLEPSEISFYLFSLENMEEQTQGFALTCSDTRIGSVLAVVENGTYDDDIPFLDFFRSNLDGYIQKTIDMYNNINEEDIIAALEKVKEFEQQTADTGRSVTYSTAYQSSVNGVYVRIQEFVDEYPGEALTKNTNWAQNAPYFDVIKSIYGQPYLTGCVATAIGQIMAYHKWPRNCTGTISNSYMETSFTAFTDPYTNNTRSFSGITYNWNKMQATTNAANLGTVLTVAETKEAKTEIGVLMAEIGGKVAMQYGIALSGASGGNVPGALNQMGYNSSGLTTYNLNLVKASIDSEKPVYVAVSDVNGYGRHAWVIDDYRTHIRMAFAIQSSYIDGPLLGFQLSNLMRCNLGWRGSCNGWYESDVMSGTSGVGTSGYAGVFDTTQYNGGYIFGDIPLIVYNITPNN